MAVGPTIMTMEKIRETGKFKDGKKIEKWQYFDDKGTLTEKKEH